MRKNKEKSVKPKFKRLLGYAAWFLAAMLLFSSLKNINRVRSIRRQVEEERQKVEKMQTDNAKIRDQIAQAQGSDFIEKQIRDRLGLSKSGEVVVILPDEEIVRSLAPPMSTNQEVLPDPNWKKWLKLFI